jgi:hypothetical protein
MSDYIPTVTDHSYEGGDLILHTKDSKEETDLISRDDEPLTQKGELLSDEQQEKLSLW